MKTRHPALAIALAAALGLAATAFASPWGGRGHGPDPEHFAERLDALDLEPETRAEIESLLEASGDEREALREQVHAAHQQMRALLEQEEPDVDAVLAQADVVGELHGALRKLKLRTMLGVRSLLTPEQREELHEGRRFGRRGHFGDRRRGDRPGLEEDGLF